MKSLTVHIHSIPFQFNIFLDCPESELIKDGICDDSMNTGECAYDGGDCCFGNPIFCEDCMCYLPLAVSSKNFPPLEWAVFINCIILKILHILFVRHYKLQLVDILHHFSMQFIL